MNKEKIRSVIIELYNENRNVVNNDVLLLERVWLKLGWDEGKSLYDNLSRVPRPESITRRRRELHEEGLIEYSKAADKEREQAFKNEVEMHGQAVSWLYD